MIVKNFMGGVGESAEIFITGLASTDNVTCTSPSSRSITPTWKSKVISGVVTYGWSIPCTEYGTYTVSASNGSKTITESVLVDACEVYEIEMEYYYYLYKDGEEYSDRTGGWSGYNSRWNSLNSAKAPTVTKNVGSISAYLGQDGYGVFRGIISTANTIDLTNYSKLKVHFVEASCYIGVADIPMNLIIANSKSDGYAPSAYAPIVASEVNVTVTRTDFTIELDISSFTGLYYAFIDFFTAYYSGRYSRVEFDKVWLE